jgi:hypothetical protein
MSRRRRRRRRRKLDLSPHQEEKGNRLHIEQHK